MSQRSRQAPLVAHVIQHLSMGGLENGLVNIINGTPSGRVRHAVVCLSHFTSFRDRICVADVPVIALHKRDGKDPSSYLRLWRVLKSLQPDIVHSRNLSAIDCAPVSWLAGVHTHVHGEHGWDTFDLHGRNAKYLRYRRWMRPFVDRYVAVSRHIEQWLRRDVGVSPERVEQIYNGVDTDRFRPRQSRTHLPEGAPFSLPADGLIVGTVGRMQRVKSPTLLVRGFAEAVARSPEARRRLRLVMVGDGPVLEEVRQAVEAGGIDDIAWLTGPREDVPDLLRLMDVFVLTSLNEGISNGILEAMATGLPVIATAVGGNPELVEAGQTGELIETQSVTALAAAIGRYLHDGARLADHGRAARTRALEKFSISTMVERYLSMYEGLLRSRSQAVPRMV